MFKNTILLPVPASTETAPEPATVVTTNLEHIDDDLRVQNASREFDDAFADFHQRGDQPSYQAMRTLYSAGMALLDALNAAEELTVRGERLIRQALSDARGQQQIEMRLEADTALTKLRHLDIACGRYSAATPGLNRFPPLFAALETYILALRAHPRYRLSNGAWTVENALHVEARDKLDAASRTTRLNKFRGAENAYRNKSTTPIKLLKIGQNYRSSASDWAEFRAMFETGVLAYACNDGGPAAGAQNGLLRAEDYATSLDTVQQLHAHRSIPAADLLAIRRYCGNSAELNRILRENDKNAVLAHGPYIRLVVSALNQLPQCLDHTILHRGVRLNAGQILSAGLFAGNRLTTRTFTNCSASSASAYCTLTDQYNVQITVQGGRARLPGAVALGNASGDDAIYGIGNTFDITGVRYLEGEGSKEYPRLNVTMEWVDMSKVRLDGRFRNVEGEIAVAESEHSDEDSSLLSLAELK